MPTRLVALAAVGVLTLGVAGCTDTTGGPEPTSSLPISTPPGQPTATSDLTMFAPTDTAFCNVSSATLLRLLSDPNRTGDILRYHVVSGRLPPDQPAGSHQTLSGVGGRTSLTLVEDGLRLTAEGRASILRP
jgi:Fasciclin domain